MTQPPPPPILLDVPGFGTIKVLFMDNKFEWNNKDEGEVFDVVPEEESSCCV